MKRTAAMAAFTLAVALAVHLDAMPASAQTPGAQGAQGAQGTGVPQPTARASFERGIRALEDNRYAEAVLALEASYHARRLPVVLYNLGLAYRGVGRYREAVEAFEGYLDDPLSGADGAQRVAVRQAVEGLRGSVGSLGLRMEPRGATVRVDGRATAVHDGRVALDPGSHILEVTAEGHRTYREELSVEPGDAVDRTVSLEPLVLPASMVASDEGSSPREDGGPTGRHRTVWGAGAWVGSSVALAAGGTALALWIDGSVQASRYDARCGITPPAADCRAVYDRTQSSLNERAAVVNIALGVSVVGLIVVAVDVLTGLLSEEGNGTHGPAPALSLAPDRASMVLQW